MLIRLVQVSLLFLSLVSLTAFAEDYSEPAMEKAKAPVETADFSNGSEYLHQPDANSLDLIPQLGLGIIATKFSSNGIKRYEGVTPIGVGVAYGITHMFAVGVDLGFTNIARTYTCSNKPCPNGGRSRGFDDPKFKLMGRNVFDRHTLRYGIDLSASLEKHKIDSSGNSNMASGGYVVAPWIGYEVTLGERHMLGAKIQYELVKADRKITDDTDISLTQEPGASLGEQTLSDGKILDLDAFYELKTKKVTYGVAVHLAHRQESRLALKDAPSAPVRDQGFTTGIKLYVPIQFSERIALLPAANFDMIAYPNSNVYDGGVGFGANVAGRFTF